MCLTGGLEEEEPDDILVFQGQQADQAAAGQSGWQLEDPHDRLHLPQRQVHRRALLLTKSSKIGPETSPKYFA